MRKQRKMHVMNYTKNRLNSNEPTIQFLDWCGLSTKSFLIIFALKEKQGTHSFRDVTFFSQMACS